MLRFQLSIPLDKYPPLCYIYSMLKSTPKPKLPASILARLQAIRVTSTETAPPESEPLPSVEAQVEEHYQNPLRMLPWKLAPSCKYTYFIPWDSPDHTLSFVGVLKAAGNNVFSATRHLLTVYAVPSGAKQINDILNSPLPPVLSQRLTPPFRFHDHTTGRKQINQMLNQ